MSDEQSENGIEIATDSDVIAAISCLDRSTNAGDADSVNKYLVNLCDNLRVPPCASGQRVIEASMAITRAIAQLGNCANLVAWTDSVSDLVEAPSAADQKTLADELRRLGSGYLNAGDPYRAELLFDMALTFQRQAGAVAVELVISIADAGAKAGNIDRGLDALRSEVVRVEQADVPDKEAKIELLTSLVAYLPQVGKADEAIAYGDELLAYRVADAEKDINDFLNAAFATVLAYIKAGRHDDAATLVRTKTNEVIQSLIDPTAQQRLHRLPSGISGTLEKMQRPEDAEQFLLALIEQCKNREMHIPLTHLTSLSALADLYTRLRSAEEAERVLAEAKRVEEETVVLARSDPGIGENLVQQGLILRQMREFDQAIEYFEGAIRVFRGSVGDADSRTLTAMMFLSSTLYHTDRKDDARDTLADCARLISTCPDETRTAEEINLIYAYADCKDYVHTGELAKNILSDAARTAQLPQDAVLSLTTLFADALQAQDKHDEALMYRQAAVELTRQLNGEPSEELGYRLGDLALTLDALSDQDKAVAAYNRSFEMIHGIELES